MIDANQITKSEVQLKQLIATYLNEYLTPSFGSSTKRDIDLRTFTLMQALGIIKENPNSFEVSRLLKITRTKAENLIYEVTLRQSTQETIEEQVINTLASPVVYKKEDRLFSFEVDNPVVKETIKYKLSQYGLATDTSHNRSLLIMHIDAFNKIYKDYVSDEVINALSEANNDQINQYMAFEEQDSLQTKKDKVIKKISEKFMDAGIQVATEDMLRSALSALAKGMRDAVIPAIIGLCAL